MTEAEVQIVFPSPHGTASIRLPWVKGKTIKQYFHHPSLTGHALAGKRKRHVLMNSKRQRLRMTYSVQPGEIIYLT